MEHSAHNSRLLQHVESCDILEFVLPKSFWCPASVHVVHASILRHQSSGQPVGEQYLPCSTEILDGSSPALQVFTDEGAVELTPALRQEFLDKTAEFGGKSALRCLALALRQLPNGSRQVGGC